jgi:SAM-dependent methyltransferase
MTAAARGKLGCQAGILTGDVEALPFKDEQFDIVVSSSSFHFWRQRELALHEIRRVLRPNGRLVVTDWCDDFVACRLCEAFLKWRDPDRPGIVSRDQCEAVLSQCDFDVLRVDKYRISLIWGLMTAVAVATRQSQ